MRVPTILLVALFVSMPLAYAAEQAGHDHAAMLGMVRPAAWTSYPILKIRMKGENREQMVVTVVPQNIVADGIEAYSNNQQDENAHRLLTMEMGGAKLDKPASGGFHWLSAREEQADKVSVASIVQSFGERGAKDPTTMFMQQKHELEIIPQPFPREHSRYRANEDWKFLVRFNGSSVSQPEGRAGNAERHESGVADGWARHPHAAPAG